MSAARVSIGSQMRNENFATQYHQMKKTRNNCLESEMHTITPQQAKSGKPK